MPGFEVLERYFRNGLSHRLLSFCRLPLLRCHHKYKLYFLFL
uniref:Uncharacterized protein n=1 Tax=Ascaris lumbricoides TaxID=6252 RepID=A0A0M3I1X7_ASCLU